MILRAEDIKAVCSKILYAVDTSDSSAVTETLELKVDGTTLWLNVTNREYYVRVKLPVGNTSAFHATVNAQLFLKLIPQITTDTIELTVDGNTLKIKGNGEYKLPLIFDNDSLLELPQISLSNVTASFNIDTSILHSILNYNTKELSKGIAVKAVQKLYYVDDKGCITFTTGACVNKFNLPSPVKILLNQKLVKLFKLFSGTSVKFSLAQDSLNNAITQTKVLFEDDVASISAILSCDDTMVNSVPVTAIRNMADTVYPYSITVNKSLLTQLIQRLVLFKNSAHNSYCKFKFGHDSVVISDSATGNEEELFYDNNSTIDNNNPYETVLDMDDLKVTLDSCTEQNVSINLGNNQSIVITRGAICNIIPEINVA